MSSRLRLIALICTTLLLAACGTFSAAEKDTTFRIGAIPDQDPQELQRMYESVSGYLGGALDVEVEYVPVRDYAASVSQFERGDLDMVFFGGLTGMQARHRVPGAVYVAQRDIDAEFRSVFIAGAATGLPPINEVAGLAALKGHSFTFGSDTSTSGRLMPQYFLNSAGVRDTDFTGQPGYSGSHDTTLKVVESGAYEVGVLSEAVWLDRIKKGRVDTAEVQEIFRTPTYHDYHWLARPDLDERFGAGFTNRVKDALIACDGSDETEKQMLSLFGAQRFVATKEDNYGQIETVAHDLGLLN